MPKKTSAVKKTNELKKKSSKLESLRLKAKLRLDKWVDEGHFVCLSTSGLRITGELNRLGEKAKDEYGDYIFKSSFGISAVIFLLVFDEISFEEMEGIPEIVRLSHTKRQDSLYLLESVGRYHVPTEQIAEISKQFELWIKLQTEVRVDSGDGMRITGGYCRVAKISSETFIFPLNGTTSFHIIRLSEVHLVRIMRENGKCVIVMHNRPANSFVTVSDATEDTNAVFDRFASLTKSIQ